MKKSRIIVIVGPNASGKTSLSIKIAKKHNGEIISADSRQVYRGLNIGSGKITKKEMRDVPHYCLDIADPKKVFSALDFKNCAEKAITDILSRGKTPIIVGGTGFYIDAALGRVKLGGIPPNHALRSKLEKYSAAKLLNMLKKLDPARAETVEQKNPRRLIRAIEIAKHGEDNTPSSLILATPARGSEGFAHLSPPWNISWLGIKRSPEELKKRIHKRLLARLPGIICEVKKLHVPPAGGGVSWKRLFDLGLEYRYASLYLQKKLTREEFVTQLEFAIWHYAKRQMTWFKKNKEIRWISSKKIKAGNRINYKE